MNTCISDAYIRIALHYLGIRVVVHGGDDGDQGSGNVYWKHIPAPHGIMLYNIADNE